MIRKLSNDGIPLYYQIKSDLRTQIEGGHLKPGDKLPSETELATLYNVSRMTLRQAITDLVEEGKLHRRRGVGTFVRHPRLVREHGSLVGFSEALISLPFRFFRFGFSMVRKETQEHGQYHIWSVQD